MAVKQSTTYTNETFKRYLMQLSSGIVWKNTTRARENETNSDAYLTEIFITANRGVLNFNVVKAFPRIVLRNAGVTEEWIDIYASDKTKIPENMRTRIVAEYTKALTSKDPVSGHLGYLDTTSGTGEYVEVYSEVNNYYRMLNGLPDIGDTEYIYNTDKRWSMTTPVHLLPLVDRLEMSAAGVLDTLQAKYPTKKYISHLGVKMVDIYTARVAERFDILWMNGSESSTLEQDFIDVYNGSKRLVNSVYYSDAFRKTNALYEIFLAMCIVFMTIQTMQYHYLSVDNIRDFYDTESLKYVYDSYGVPFYNEIPLDYHRKIVKNINRLIGYKGSSKVFFDLFEIFDLAEMDIYSYFLTKIHKLDEHGNPLFIIKKDSEGKDMYDDEGNPILDPSNYDIAFARSKIYADPALSISDQTNTVDYDIMTTSDPYWIEDQNLKNKIQGESFNFTESKYIGVQTIFDLLRIAYENAYIFKMITDNKQMTDAISFRWSELNINTSLFELFVYLAALFCKAYGYEGQISSKVPYTSAVLGYDFQTNVKELQKYIASDKYLSRDTKLVDLILNMNITNLASVTSVFDNLYAIQDLLIARYTAAESREEFYVYKELYDSLLTSQIIEDVFKKSDGSVATTFEDLLGDASTDLLQRYGKLSTSEVEDELHLVIDKVEELITSIRYLPFSAGLESSRMIESLFKILGFFKSAKAELTGYNIIYNITMRGMNFFKMMDNMVAYYNYGVKLSDDFYQYDIMKASEYLIRLKSDAIGLLDNENIHNHYSLSIKDHIDRLDDEFRMTGWLAKLPFEDDTQYIDFMTSIVTKEFLSSVANQCDKYDLVDLAFPTGQIGGRYKDAIESLADKLIILANIPSIKDKMSISTLCKSINQSILKNAGMISDSSIHDKMKSQAYNQLIKDIGVTLDTTIKLHYDMKIYEKVTPLINGEKLSINTIEPVLTDSINDNSTILSYHEHFFDRYGSDSMIKDSVVLVSGEDL